MMFTPSRKAAQSHTLCVSNNNNKIIIIIIIVIIIIIIIIIIKIIIIITMVSCIILKGQCVVGIPNNQILISSIITWQVLGQAKMRGLQTDLMGKLHKTSHSCPPLQEFRHALNLCTRPVRSPQTTAIWKKERIKVSIPGQVIIPIRWAKLGLQVQVRK